MKINALLLSLVLVFGLFGSAVAKESRNMTESRLRNGADAERQNHNKPKRETRLLHQRSSQTAFRNIGRNRQIKIPNQRFYRAPTFKLAGRNLGVRLNPESNTARRALTYRPDQSRLEARNTGLRLQRVKQRGNNRRLRRGRALVNRSPVFRSRLLSKRTRHFDRPSKFRRVASRSRKPAPRRIKQQTAPEMLMAKEDLVFYLSAMARDGMLNVKDKLAKENWKAWIVAHPSIRKVGRDYVAQAGFYGTLGDDNRVHPLVLQFRLKGNKDKWHVKSVQVVSVNSNKRQGAKQFVHFATDEATQQLVVVEDFNEEMF